MTSWTVGVDVGGTFTDFAAREMTTGRTLVHKRPSTPHDPSRAIISGLRELIEREAIDPAQISRVGHGTTVATNALLQRKGANVALVTTKGFRDLIEIGRQVRPHMYDLQLDAPKPLVPRALRFEVDERIGPKGQIIQPLSEEAVAALIDQVARVPDLQGVAVCLIFSFLNDHHERRIADALRDAFPDKVVSVSSEVQPEFREFERFSTTVINAFLQPEVSSYMERLRLEVETVAPNAAFGIFQSSGGLMSVDRATRFPVRTALSGPAAGAVGAAGVGGFSGIGDIITLDIGGTSTDVCLIRNGRTAIASTRDIAGFRIRLPMVDIHTIGAGGGSIARLGEDGLMKVGPESAGAIPGPACYGKGGTLPTVSDANAILGRLPTELAGGDMKIDRELAVTAVSGLASSLGLTVERTALGIAGIVTSNIVRAIRAISVEKGYDPRKFALMPFGGAGGLHAADVARALGVTRIIVPPSPGILCAEGLIVADLQEDFVATCRIRLEGDMSAAAATAAQLVRQGLDWLASEGAGASETRLILSLDMRYVGQNYELPVEVSNEEIRPQLPEGETLRQAFLETYRRNYGYADTAAPVEIINIRLRAVARLPQGEKSVESQAGEPAPLATLGVWFDDKGSTPTPVYDRRTLRRGTEIAGPAIITQLDSTTVVPPDFRIAVDAAMNLIMEPQHA